MLDYYYQLHPVWAALLAGLFTYAFTAAGASLVLFTPNASKKLLDFSLGAAAGIMIAASFWSLLAPALALSGESWGKLGFVPVAGGFLAGGLFLRLIDMLLPHLHLNSNKPEGLKTKWQKSILLVLAITLHNIPEGLALGVAFGAAGLGLPQASTGAAISLALGLGLQNLPEGAAVALPLRREGLSRGQSFFWGQLSGLVEPAAAVAGAALVAVATPILPSVLAFAAGAMIFVVVEEVIPESQSSGNSDRATMGCLLGFAVMMVLDTALA